MSLLLMCGEAIVSTTVLSSLFMDVVRFVGYTWKNNNKWCT